MTSISVAFETLFFGAGAWLGLLLLLALIIVLSKAQEYAGLLMVPVTIFLGLAYIENELMWNALIMFITTAFLILSLARGKG